MECRSVPTETVGRRHRWSPSKPLETCRCHRVAQRSSHRRQLSGPWGAASGEMYNVNSTWELLGKRGMKKWTLARRSQGPINISVCICIDQMHRLTVAIYLSRFDDVPTVLVPESRTCQVGHRPTGYETPIVRSFQPNPIHGTVTVD